MKQITEDHVSYETAKLLKEKGFNEVCFAYYSEFVDNWITLMLWKNFPRTYYTVRNSGYVLVPTHQMALKWLREVHKCYTHICPFYPDMKYNEPPKWLAAVDYNGEGYPTLPKRFDSYEEAVEASLLYVLKNLI